jgi:uncharacterized protein (TIGR02118 family)
MVKLLILFGIPEDGGAFNQHFDQIHRGLLLALPNVQGLEVNRVFGAAIGDSPYCNIVEIQFADKQRMQDSLSTDAGLALARDFANFATGGTTLLFCQSDPLSAQT